MDSISLSSESSESTNLRASPGFGFGLSSQDTVSQGHWTSASPTRCEGFQRGSMTGLFLPVPSPKPHSGVTLTPRNYDDIRKLPLSTVPNQPNSVFYALWKWQSLKIPTFKHLQARQHESLIPLPPMTRTCELEHATMQTRSHGHKIQIEIFGNSNHGLSIWCSGCNVNCQQRCCNDAPSRSGDTALHCISLHHCIALKWDLALKNLEPSHIAHMDKLYKLAKMKRIEKSTCAWWQCHAQSS